MSAKEGRSLVRLGVVLLTLAVIFCLVLPMAGGGAMSVAMVCCFVLAILLTVAILIGPTRNASVAPELGHKHLRPADVLAVARAPDPVALGALLI